MNLPNILTCSRIVFAAILVVLLLQNSLIADIAALIIFIAASVTDFYDGYLAKKMGLTSNFGKIMDPIADKVLMLSLFGIFAYKQIVIPWMVVVIALREVLVTISRLNALRKGQVLPAERAGKIKTVVQITTIVVIFLYMIASESSFDWFLNVEAQWTILINALMGAAIILTVYSGLLYFRAKWKGQTR